MLGKSKRKESMILEWNSKWSQYWCCIFYLTVMSPKSSLRKSSLSSKASGRVQHHSPSGPRIRRKCMWLGKESCCADSVHPSFFIPCSLSRSYISDPNTQSEHQPLNDRHSWPVHNSRKDKNKIETFTPSSWIHIHLQSPWTFGDVSHTFFVCIQPITQKSDLLHVPTLLSHSTVVLCVPGACFHFSLIVARTDVWQNVQ